MLRCELGALSYRDPAKRLLISRKHGMVVFKVSGLEYRTLKNLTVEDFVLFYSEAVIVSNGSSVESIQILSHDTKTYLAMAE